MMGFMIYYFYNFCRQTEYIVREGFGSANDGIIVLFVIYRCSYF